MDALTLFCQNLFVSTIDRDCGAAQHSPMLLRRNEGRGGTEWCAFSPKRQALALPDITEISRRSLAKCWTQEVNLFVQSFQGLTQLYNPTVDPAEITADVVAITGLDGHAYGSLSGGYPKRHVASRFPQPGFTKLPSDDLRI